MTDVGLKFAYYEGIVIGFLPFRYHSSKKLFYKSGLLKSWSIFLCLMNILLVIVTLTDMVTFFIESFLDSDFLIFFLGISNNILYQLHIFVYVCETVVYKKLILKLLNRGSYLIQKISILRWENYRKKFIIQTFLRYISVVIVVILNGFLLTAPRSFFEIISSVFQFTLLLHALQYFFESFTLAAIFVEDIARDVEICNMNNFSIIRMINKWSKELFVVNKYKDHLQQFYSWSFLPIFGASFFSLNNFVSYKIFI